MVYQAPKIVEISLAMDHPERDNGVDTASCCTGHCCYGSDDAACNLFF